MIVFISAGEASGDAYGAALISEMRRLAPKAEIEFWAIGGRRLSDGCDKLVADSARWGAISFTQSAKSYFRIIPLALRIRRRLRRPGSDVRLLIPIDFGFFNSRLARSARRSGWKVLSFIPPGSWRRDRQAAWAPQIYDAVSTPFSWSAEILERNGTPAVHWFGHPLKQLVRERTATTVEPRNQIALLPGSRAHELAMNLPLIAASLPDLPGEFALAAGTDVTAFARRWNALAPGRKDVFTVGDASGVLLRSRAAIVCSGTATLEAALCRCPMAVIYALSRTMEFERRLFGIQRPKFVALPNILLDRLLVREFVAEDALPEKVGPFVRELLKKGPEREAQLAGFDELDGTLGPDDAITKTARLALEMLGVATPPPTPSISR